MAILRKYQADAASWLLSRRNGALFADPGTGKTLTILTLLRRLKLTGSGLRALVIAPIRVVHNVWPQEISKWGFDFSCAILHGNKKTNVLLHDTSDIHLINPEGLKWFDTMAPMHQPYDILILDESSLFRNPTSVRMKILRKYLPLFDRRYILTGTPTPRSLEDLWSQMYICDLGTTLGERITHYRNAYFYKVPIKDRVYKYRILPGKEEMIWNRVAHLCYRIDAETCLDLPALFTNDIYVTLPSKANATYRNMEKQLFAEIEGKLRFAVSASAKYGLCKQLASGALYDKDGADYAVQHDAKLQALDELRAELGNKPLLVVFQYRHELKRLQKKYGASLPAIAGGIKESQVKKLLEKWNRGKLPLLAAQSQSISHGLNMQAGGNDVCWLTLTDDYDIYEQLNRRIYRSGVEGTVRIHRILAKDTIDHALAANLNRKKQNQQGLLDALQNYKGEKE
jgi:SNF2 family DNA or RNA helicase